MAACSCSIALCSISASAAGSFLAAKSCLTAALLIGAIILSPIEVTSIGDRIMAPMSSDAVRQLFKSRRLPAADAEMLHRAIEHEQAAISAEF